MDLCLWLVRHTLRHAACGLGGLAPVSLPLGIRGSSLWSSAAIGTAAISLPRLLRISVQDSLSPLLAAAHQPGPAAAQPARNSSGTSVGRKRVAVGISGGVDSAVAALLLQRQGHDVMGVFMRNWDEGEERGNQNCSVERDLQDAAMVCRQLGIPLHEANFVSAYWNQVFSEFIAQLGRGLTPNPDLACNRHIKFDALLKFANQLGAELVATGHYAQLATSSGGGGVRLLRGADRLKEQSYFLASVQPAALQRVLFPVGHLQKPEVRAMAAKAGLATANKRSSAGICFIGRRDFGDFLLQYNPPLAGRYVDVDSGAQLGPCPDIAAVTHGQRPGIGGAAERVYAVGKDVVERVVYVAQGRQHPTLLCTTALLRTPHWLSVEHARQLAAQGRLRCQYKARYGQQPKPCTIYAIDPQAAAGLAAEAARVAAAAGVWEEAGGSPDIAPAAAAAGGSGVAAALAAAGGVADVGTAVAAAAEQLGFHPSAYCRLQPEDSRTLPSYLVVHFDEPALAITPQQACVLYDGELCLGTALIALPGRSLHEAAAAGETAAVVVDAADAGQQERSTAC